MKHQSGFTLIQLIMVIVILGILAATALPKFSDLKYDARLSSLEGLKGSMDAAGAIAHGTQLAKGYVSNVDVILSGNSVSMVNGYPASGATGIMLALDVSPQKFVWHGASGAIALSGAQNCYVQWSAATATAAASTTVVSTGC